MHAVHGAVSAGCCLMSGWWQCSRMGEEYNCSSWLGMEKGVCEKILHFSWPWMEMIFGPMKSPCVDAGCRSFELWSENAYLIPFLLENLELWELCEKGMSILQVQKESRSSLKDPDLLLSSAADGIMMPLTCGMHAVHQKPWCSYKGWHVFTVQPKSNHSGGKRHQEVSPEVLQPWGWSSLLRDFIWAVLENLKDWN